MVWALFGSLWGHYSLQTASKVKSDLRFEISDPNYLLIHVHIVYMVWTLLAASEATTASKQPRRSKLSLQMKLGAPIYYMTKFQGIFIIQKSLMSGGGEDDKHDPLTRSAIAARNKDLKICLQVLWFCPMTSQRMIWPAYYQQMGPFKTEWSILIKENSGPRTQNLFTGIGLRSGPIIVDWPHKCMSIAFVKSCVVTLQYY